MEVNLSKEVIDAICCSLEIANKDINREIFAMSRKGFNVDSMKNQMVANNEALKIFRERLQKGE